jgi:hypothetical protein
MLTRLCDDDWAMAVGAGRGVQDPGECCSGSGDLRQALRQRAVAVGVRRKNPMWDWNEAEPCRAARREKPKRRAKKSDGTFEDIPRHGAVEKSLDRQFAVRDIDKTTGST